MMIPGDENFDTGSSKDEMQMKNIDNVESTIPSKETGMNEIYQAEDRSLRWGGD